MGGDHELPQPLGAMDEGDGDGLSLGPAVGRHGLGPVLAAEDYGRVGGLHRLGHRLDHRRQDGPGGERGLQALAEA
jgi:hypothetical protein